MMTSIITSYQKSNFTNQPPVSTTAAINEDQAMSTITVSETKFNDANQRLQSAKATLSCLAAMLREGIMSDEHSAEAIQGVAFSISDACELLNQTAEMSKAQ